MIARPARVVRVLVLGVVTGAPGQTRAMGAGQGDAPPPPTSIPVAVPSISQDAAIDGPTLARRVRDRADGDTSKTELTMTLIDHQGRREERVATVSIMSERSSRKKLIRFSAPADVAGTGFLSWEDDASTGEQFLYLPSLGDVRRISTQQRDRRFVGTDMSYEDLQQFKVEGFEHRITASETFEGFQCWLLESTRVDPGASQYARILHWIDKASLVEVKNDYFDGQGNHVKRFIVSKLEKSSGYWTALESSIEDLKLRHRTELKVIRVTYNKDVPAEIFTRAALKNPGRS